MGATAKMGRFQIAHKFSRESTAWNDKWKGQHPETPLFVALDRGFYDIGLSINYAFLCSKLCFFMLADYAYLCSDYAQLCLYAFMLEVCQYAFFSARIIGLSQLEVHILSQNVLAFEGPFSELLHAHPTSV